MDNRSRLCPRNFRPSAGTQRRLACRLRTQYQLDGHIQRWQRGLRQRRLDTGFGTLAVNTTAAIPADPSTYSAATPEAWVFLRDGVLKKGRARITLSEQHHPLRVEDIHDRPRRGHRHRCLGCAKPGRLRRPRTVERLTRPAQVRRPGHPHTSKVPSSRRSPPSNTPGTEAKAKSEPNSSPTNCTPAATAP